MISCIAHNTYLQLQWNTQKLRHSFSWFNFTCFFKLYCNLYLTTNSSTFYFIFQATAYVNNVVLFHCHT